MQFAAGDISAPAPESIEAWVQRVLPDTQGEIVIRVVGEAESAALNERFRGKAGPTNVLAFLPGEPAESEDGLALLGDVAVCADIVEREAREQHKAPEAHWAHVVVHACLHLIGFDHMTPGEAEEMEARERLLLAELGIADPYRIDA